MHKGRIIFLNGVTSSGKTSIVEALQNRKDCYFYVVANDLFEQMMAILADNPLSIVEVACPLEVCRMRNIARADRYEHQSAEQAALMTQNIAYAMTVQTDQKSPEECAEAIVRTLME